MNKTISIEWLEDSSDCDLCGYNYASGAKVKFSDDNENWESIPAACCYDGNDMDQSEVYKKILETLGYEVIETFGDENL